MKAIAKLILILLFYAFTNSVSAQCPSETLISVTGGTGAGLFEDIGQTFTIPSGSSGSVRLLEEISIISSETGALSTKTPTLSIYEGIGYGGTLLYEDNHTFALWPSNGQPADFVLTESVYLSSGAVYTFRIQNAGSSFTGNNRYSGGTFYFPAAGGEISGQDHDFQMRVSPEVEIAVISGANNFTCGSITLSTATSATAYQWSEDGVAISEDTGNTLIVDQFLESEAVSRSYAVETTFSNGCSTTSGPHQINGDVASGCGTTTLIDQPSENGGLGNGSFQAFGQSFTMPTDESAYVLESIELLSGDFSVQERRPTIKIFEGEGFEGRQLYVERVITQWPLAGSYVEILLSDGPLLEAGGVYTFQIQSGGFYMVSTENPYSGGIRFAGNVEPEHDLAFRVNTFNNSMLSAPTITVGEPGPEGDRLLTTSSVGECSFRWYRNNQLIPDANNNIYTVLATEPGQFHVAAIDESGCNAFSGAIDLAPPVLVSSTALSIQENSTSIDYSVVATDSSLPVRYSMGTGNDESFFAIDSNTGELTIQTAFDFESPQDADADNVYELSVIATDASSNQGTLQIEVTIEDLDENAPEITSSSAYDYVEGETSAAFLASANDESTVTFSLGAGIDNAVFNITDAEVFFIVPPVFSTPLDANEDNVYEIELIATDAVGNTTSMLINITIIEIESDEPVITSSTTSSIVEESDLLAYTITATDQSAITFSLGTTKDETHFVVDEASGEVSFINVPDFENPTDVFGAADDNNYVVDVVATDFFGNTSIQETIISVTNNPSDECNVTLKFDGSNDHIRLSETLAIGGTPFTIEMWIKTDDNSRSVLLGNFDASINANFEITTAGKLRVYWNNGSPDLTGSAVVRDGEWHHIAFVRDVVPGAITIYVDGEIDASTSSNATAITFAEAHWIGADIRSGTHHYEGSMDDLRIWNMALTPEELNASISGSLDLTSSGLLSNYTFEEGSGTTLTDSKGSNDGTVFGTPVWERINGSDPSVPSPQVITFDALPSKTALDLNTSFELTSTGGTSGNPVTYTSSDETVATISGGKVTLLELGETTISANQAGAACYAAAAELQQVLTLSKLDQVISFDALPSKIFGDAEFDLVATGGASGNPVTFSSSDETVVTISGNTVTIVGAGSTTINANQVGDADYNPATSVTQVLTVDKAALTATADDQSITFGEALSTFSITYAGLLNGDTEAAIDTAPIIETSALGLEASDAGTYPITLSGGSDNNYELTLIDGTLTINKADQLISFDAIADIDLMNTNIVTLNGTSDAGLPIAYSLQVGDGAITGSVLTVNNSGNFTVEANQAGNTNYNAAAVSQSFVVVDSRKEDQTITFESLPSKTYGDTDFDLTASVSSGLAVTYTSSDASVATVSGSTVTITGAGIATIMASQDGDTDYNPATSVTQVLTVDKAALTATADDQSITFGEALPTFSITYAGLLNGDTEAAIDTRPIAESAALGLGASDAGTYLITLSGGSDNNYELTFIDGTLTINKADQLISFDAIADIDLVNTNTVTLDGTSDAELPIAYGLQVGDGAITGSVLTVNNSGNFTVEANQAGNTNYNAAAVSQSFVVVDSRKEDQTITFESLPSKTYGDTDFDLTASASSGLAVTYSSSDETVASVSGSTVTITGAGTATIMASQDGDTDYNPATSVTQVLTVDKAALTATADDQQITFGEALSTFSITYAGLLNGDTEAAIDTAPIIETSALGLEASDAGTYPITLSGGSDNNYELTLIDGTLTINKADQTIIFDTIAEIDIATTTEVELNATSDAGLGVTFTLVEGNGAIAGTTLTANTSGTFTVVASQAGNTNYNTAAVSQSFAVIDSRKEDQTIDFSELADKHYGDGLTLAATATSNLPVTYSVLSGPATVSGAEVTITGVGEVTIESSQVGDDSFNAAPTITQSFEVGQATLSVTAENQLKTYGEANPTLILTYAGFQNGEDETMLTTAPTVSTTADEASAVGTYTIVASGGAADNYSFNYTDGTLTVNPATLTLVADNQTKTYNTVNPTLTISYGGFMGGDTEADLEVIPTVSTTALTDSDAGTYPITVTGGVAMNYMFAYTEGALTIGKAALTVTADDQRKNYSGDNPTLTLTYAGFLGSDDEMVLDTAPTASTDATTTSDVGAYSITTSGGVDNNYMFNYTDGTLTINKADQTITFETLAEQAVGDAAFDLTATASSGLTITYTSSDENVATISGSTVTILNAGATTITASQAGGTNFNAAADVAQTLTVNNNIQDQTITFETLGNQAYGASPFELAAVASSGLVVSYTSSDENVATITGSTVTILSVGTTTITANQAGNDSYTAATDVSQTLSIDPATLTVKADDQVKVYGEANLTLTLTYAGFQSGEDETVLTTVPTIATIAEAGSDVGTYAIEIAGGSAANYTITPVNGTLTITKANLMITADDQTMRTGDAVPALTTTITGFVNEDVEADLDILPAIATAVTSSSPSGLYDITLTGGEDNNYEFTLINGTLTVETVLGLVLEQTQIMIYPNPVVDKLYIDFPQSLSGEEITVQLFDMEGRKLQSQRVEGYGIELDVSQISTGMLILQMSAGGEVIRRRVKKD